MFKLNDYVVYGLTGVCEVVEITKEKYATNEELEHYILEPLYQKNMRIKIPVSNQKILMRNVITKDEALSLIDMMSKKETEWIEDDKERNADFKETLKTGNCEGWISIIKTIYLKKQEKISAGKKLTKADDDIMKFAEKQLNEEFAAVLNISPEEAHDFILERIS